MENPIKTDDLGIPPFQETSIWAFQEIPAKKYSTGNVFYMLFNLGVPENWPMNSVCLQLLQSEHDDKPMGVGVPIFTQTSLFLYISIYVQEDIRKIAASVKYHIPHDVWASNK